MRSCVFVLSLFAGTVFTITSGAAAGKHDLQGRADQPRAIRALYVTGGGFHEFVKQEGIVPPAIAQRANVAWTVDHTAGTSTEKLIDRHKDIAWTKEFDVVLYNMSFSFVVE